VTRRNVVGWLAGNVVAVLIVALAWIGASGATTLRAQVPYINIGVLGLLVAAFANAVMLAQAHREVDARTRRLLGRFDPGPAQR
jgi:DMSO/TMAO reductase YedYZ heme-binding membrane subunit